MRTACAVSLDLTAFPRGLEDSQLHLKLGRVSAEGLERLAGTFSRSYPSAAPGAASTRGRDVSPEPATRCLDLHLPCGYLASWSSFLDLQYDC